ncbi:MAG: matrix metalloproteinase-11 [Methylocystis sp.]|nr:matrix metalloproteinase-11 [Methylocystis sp.]
MAKKNSAKKSKTVLARTKKVSAQPFATRKPEDAARKAAEHIHVFGKGVVCETDIRGLAMPGNRSPLEIVVDASNGFIPLWAKDMTLRWRFQEQSMAIFENAEAAKDAIKELMGEAILAWGDAAPVRFSERDDAWDFEIVVREADRCSPNGCVLASAFFPDAGRHELVIYPKLFTQDRKEQVETLVHEIGHIFGLRHFFANISETRWPSQIFGAHKPFSIMNYGNQSELTEDDRADLKDLYQKAWSGELTSINGTPIRLVKPFNTLGPS